MATLELTDAVRRDVERALAARGTPFATFPDGVVALATGEQSIFYVLVFPGPDGAGRAREALARADALREALAIEVVPIWMDCTPLAHADEGALLIQAATPHACTPLARLADGAERDRILSAVRAHPRLTAVIADDVWTLARGSGAPLPILVSTERVTGGP